MKRLTAMFLTLLLLLSLSACGTASQNQTDNTDSGNSQTEEPTVTDDGTETESGFPFTQMCIRDRPSEAALPIGARKSGSLFLTPY